MKFHESMPCFILVHLPSCFVGDTSTLVLVTAELAMRSSRRRCHLWRFGAIASAVTARRSTAASMQTFNLVIFSVTWGYCNMFLSGIFRMKPLRSFRQTRHIGLGPPTFLDTKYSFDIIQTVLGENSVNCSNIGCPVHGLNDEENYHFDLTHISHHTILIRYPLAFPQIARGIVLDRYCTFEKIWMRRCALPCRRSGNEF